ncbi:MAG: carboxypeptidase-like regulatory domain-containing protein [Salinimicrobium sp.]
MKSKQLYFVRYLIILFLFLSFSTGVSGMSLDLVLQQNPAIDYAEYKGKVVNKADGAPLASTFLAVEGTNISTVSNNEGEFSLKIPNRLGDVNVIVSHLGFQSRSIPLDFFKQGEVVIKLDETIEELSEVSLFTYTNPSALVRNMLKNRGVNYLNDRANMTAFYRETIKRGRKNVSLSEAVVTIHKEAYDSSADDNIALVKARKTADYDRLDTLALKLRGGPYNPLSIDIMKNPTNIFNYYDLSNFNFEFDKPTKINDRYLYVVNFEELIKEMPWYYGKLYIDAETFTLVKASYNLNVDNRSAATQLFVKKKPGGTRVYPVDVHYEIQYRERDGRWYFGYADTQLEFVVNWKRRLFNSRYKINSELAVTDWQINPNGRVKKNDNFINPRIVMTDDISGFADIAFWGENNIIEPDKSIENAIDKIRKNLKDN